MNQTFRLTMDGKSLAHARYSADDPIFTSIVAMLDDFKEAFPWLSVYGFGGQGGIGYHAIHKIYRGVDANGDKILYSATGSPYSMPEEVMYTMLKLAGVDVSKYGFDEEWE